MRARQKAVAAEIASLKKEREEIRNALAAVENKVSQSPLREQEMISMIRDYENQKRSYDDLLRKKLEATSPRTSRSGRKARSSRSSTRRTFRRTVQAEPPEGGWARPLLASLFSGSGWRSPWRRRTCGCAT
jgi:uncharacterized protein involved in exopolysaccharide biosynthesis